MSAERKSSGRRTSDEAVTIQLVEPLDADSKQLRRLLAELNKGHTVRIACEQGRAAKAGLELARPRSAESGGHLSLSEVATALSGGAALGLASLAFAPASALAAGIAALVGVGLSGALRKTIDKYGT